MENENEDQTSKEDENPETSRQEGEQSKSKQVAKDLVELTHVEVKKQEVSKETIQLAEAFKQKEIEDGKSTELSNDEITILETFMGKRLFLNRIAIIANQSRIPLGIEPFNKADLEDLLNKLSEKGYVTSEIVESGTVYYLTDKGKEHVQ